MAEMRLEMRFNVKVVKLVRTQNANLFAVTRKTVSENVGDFFVSAFRPKGKCLVLKTSKTSASHSKPAGKKYIECSVNTKFDMR